MELNTAVTSLAALAQENRLAIYRYLVQAGHAGAAVGTIGEHFDIPGATLSFHLKTLKQADLIVVTRAGRSLIYSANYAAMNGLISYLMENCCAGTACDMPRLNCAESAPASDAKNKEKP
jgi:DNA-binding transcriptional ArsR family regulator